MPLTRAELQRLVDLEAALQGVDPTLARSVAQAESGFDPAARSPKGARGVMQLMPGTAKGLGVDPDDPADNVHGGIQYLAQLSKQYGGDRELTLAAYNAGPGAVDRYKGVPPFKETQSYVAKILGMLGPASAEAGTLAAPPQGRLEALEAELARREGQPTGPAASPSSRLDLLEAELARRGGQGTAPQAPADLSGDSTYAADTIRAMRQRQASPEPPSDLTIPIEKASPDAPPYAQAVQEMAPLDPNAASQMLAARSPLPSAGEQARTVGALAVPAITATGGAIAGGVLGGPAGATAGGIAGGVYGTRLSKQLGLAPQEAPLIEETVVGPIYPSDALNVAVPLATRALAPVATKVGNAVAGVTRPARQQLMDLARRWGVRLSFGDVARGSLAPKVESVLEQVPGVGAGAFRVGQQADVAQAGARLTDELRTAMVTTPWRNLAQVQRVAGQQTSQGKAARALLAEIDQSGDDWGRVVQASGKLNLFQDRLRAQQLYDRVDDLATPLGNMPLPQTTRAIDAAVQDVRGAVLPSPEVQREVEGLMTRARTAITPTPGQPPPDTSYTRMRRLRSDLGDMQRTATDPATARYLGNIKTALEQDAAAFATQSGVPALQQAHRQADQFYRTRVVRYREGALAEAIKKDLPDEIYNKFVRQGADRAQQFYNGLDPRGQAAVRYGMVQEATDAATNGALDVFSPAKFAQSLGRIQEASGVFFRGEPQWEINGFRRLMAHAQRAGQYAENPPTGQRTIAGALLGGAAATDLSTTAQVWASAKGLQMLFMTRPGRNFLLAASDLQPGSPAFTRRLDQFLRSPAVAPVVAGTQGAVRAQEVE